ncbi:amidohydrolase [Tabrizicola sp.]|uniref:amidohydrolase family protein n=1 Tax=Tabrizicola sp. TaxID=2005166 RepID=UPI0035B2B910
MDLIDTHQHLIWRDRLGYGWTAGIPALAEGDFTPEDYQAQTKGQGIAGTIFMECGVDDADYQAEARYVATRVGRDGILGQIASCRPETDAGFDAWLEECGAHQVKGFRRILHVVPDEMSQNEVFRANLRKIGRKGLPFDMCFLARQLSIAEALARACDGQQLVLDHCGVPDIAGGVFDDWAKGIDRLAALPHVSVKLSGISAYAAPGTASVELLRPWVGHVLDRFGADRVVWGSDWPVVLLGAGLLPWIEMTRNLLAGLSAGEQSAVGAGNARRIYRV